MSPSVKQNAIADHARSTAIYGHRPGPARGRAIRDRECCLLSGGVHLYVSDQLGILSLSEQPEGEGSSEASIMARRARIKLD